jgi:hypothetical protein
LQEKLGIEEIKNLVLRSQNTFEGGKYNHSIAGSPAKPPNNKEARHQNFRIIMLERALSSDEKLPMGMAG